MERVNLMPGDCLEILSGLDAESFDACVTDPPYHLTSIVKRFGADNAAPVKAGVYARSSTGFMGKKWDGGDVAFDPETWRAVYRVMKPGAHLLAFGGTRTYHRMACAIEDAGFEVRDAIQWLYGSGFPKSHNIGEGWGTALKPACEPIVLARKPLSESTIAANVLKWGTGAINVDGCRVATDGESFKRPVAFGPDLHEGWARPWQQDPEALAAFEARKQGAIQKAETLGRWPANVIHDGSDEVVAGFPETTSGALTRSETARAEVGHNGIYGRFNGAPDGKHFAGSEGSAARFFYTAKADSDDRLGSKHPTVKPVDLIQYLVRLVTPKGGLVLDPFAGTGTTGEACIREGMRATLIEREEEYQADIRRRLKLAMAGPDERVRETNKAKNPNPDLGPLFTTLTPEQ
jgi:site-specific DNA-methyltransferase (adenine-specific)